MRNFILMAAVFISAATCESQKAQDSKQPPQPKMIALRLHWDGFNERFLMKTSQIAGRTPPFSIEDIKKNACGIYQEPQHCERTVQEMIDNSTFDQHWQILEGDNGSIYTINTATCKMWNPIKKKLAKKCDKKPDDFTISYDAFIDGDFLIVRFDSPIKEAELLESFVVFNAAPRKAKAEATNTK